MTGTGVLTLPADVAARLPKSGPARIIVLTPDASDDWQSVAYEQFLRNDDPSDAVDDELR